MKHPVLPRGRELGLPVVSGLLLTLAFPPFHLILPSFIALVPYLVFLAGCPGDETGKTSALRGTFWMGIVYYGTLLYWLFVALVFYTWLSLLGYLIAVVVLSAFLMGVGYGAHRLRTQYAIPFWASLPILWTAVEWLRGHLADVSFPWLGLGHSLTGYPALVGFADVTGARGVTFWLVAVNALLAEWWLASDRRRRWARHAAVLVAVLTVPVGYSLLRWYSLETREAARVIVVQPNIPEDLKLDPRTARDSSRTALSNLTQQALTQNPDADLVVWPETALPDFLERNEAWRYWSYAIARRNRVGLLYGAKTLEEYPDGGIDYYNASVYVKPFWDSAHVYRKHYLVPVVERVPFLPIDWVRDLRVAAVRNQWHLPLIGDIAGFLQYFGGFARGREEPVFAIAGSGFGVLICYESIFPQLSRRYRRQGADFVVNITNDAWFGRQRPWWSRSSALFQHPAHLVMRAIENRMGVARSANTGISLFVDPRGRIYESTPLFTAESRVATVHSGRDLTLYTRLGDWIGWLCVAGTIVQVGLVAWRREAIAINNRS